MWLAQTTYPLTRRNRQVQCLIQIPVSNQKSSDWVTTCVVTKSSLAKASGSRARLQISNAASVAHVFPYWQSLQLSSSGCAWGPVAEASLTNKEITRLWGGPRASRYVLELNSGAVLPFNPTSGACNSQRASDVLNAVSTFEGNRLRVD